MLAPDERRCAVAGPLAGLSVLDFTRALAGPYATMILADLGADVMKVEQPGSGDFTRENGPHVRGVSSYFLSINRGKRSLTLDLRHPEGLEIALRLAECVEVLVENFRPGVMERLGLGYEVLCERNPRLIYASVSGFGQTGPYASRPAYDMIAQGMGGAVSITGEPGRPPVRVGFSIGDIGASLFAVVGILAALSNRDASGEGQWVDVAMLDSQVALCENAVARYLATGEVPEPIGTRHPVITPFQIFATKDGYIVLVVPRQAQWEAFCHSVGREDLLADERFEDNASRTRHHGELEPVLSDIMLTRTTEEWLAFLDERGIICSPVNTIDKVVADPHVRAREMICELRHPQLGSFKAVGSPIKFSRPRHAVERAAPQVGEHTYEILRTRLGMDDDDLARLRKEGVV